MATSTVENTGYCFIPSGLSLPQRHINVHCPSSKNVLLMFLIYGIISIITSLILGSDNARRSLSLWGRRRYRRRPSFWPGVATAILHIFFAMAATKIIINGGFKAGISSLCLLWITRPRFSAVMTIRMNDTYYQAYSTLLFDHFIAEAILEIVVLLFATKFVGAPRSSDPFCDGVEMTSWQKHLRFMMAGAGWALIATGVAHIFVLGAFLVSEFYVRNAKMYSESERRWDGFTSRVVEMGWVISWISFIASWVLWATFLQLAGEAYCPSNIGVVSVLFGCLPLVASLVRPGTNI
ncbi:hypothetical protein BGZ61DRAFT_533140 [Ilyonectria robusta]|uniref:uncharacterized protein n=1 Tax=Ilyonectria robusta TaxID=1079257 RepID=UPI001E8E8509|nr:uncharacterized protein BGZ61DRAFT_533140 [Ilyonectria robusta]KAH8688356.1 hypothetical protein BGZ61DRAFT_533140 [Ilyonectria robusta]